MKKIFYPALVLTLSVLLSAPGFAQGIYQLWGMTSQGGTDDIGALFRADGEGKNLKSMFSFTKTNPGAIPMYNQLTEYNGKFYSMTSEGGKDNLGVIFEWNPITNIYSKKYDFETANGNSPHGSLVLLGSKFYGMTNSGGSNNLGVIFEWDPATNIYSKKYDFDGTKGGNPYGSLLLNGGKFYGMTSSGGTNNLGVIFEWDPVANAYTKKYDFDGATGSNPYGDLAFYNGKFYGMTKSGGGINGRGVIFEWIAATNSYTMKFEFIAGAHLGASPYGSLVLVNDKFYGMTSAGTLFGSGVIFEWDPIANNFTKKLEIGDNSENPFGNLLYTGGKFYGMVFNRGGGKFSRGFLFEWNPVTDLYTRKYIYENNSTDDDSYNGANPRGSLVVSGGKIYGMTSYGGSSESGVIFEWNPGSNTYTKKINLNHPDNGESPNSLVYQEGHLYGISSAGGPDGLGAIFEWDYISNKFIKKYDLNPAPGNGRRPTGNLVFCNGKFYGMTFFVTAGPAFHQAIFEWDPVTNNYTQKASFQLGTQPTGNLVESGGKIYGMYKGGGIFEWDPSTNLFTKLYQFANAIEGSTPIGGLVENAGKLYGMTSSGGLNNAGVIFEWNILAKTYTKRHDFNNTNGAYPYGNLVIREGIFYGVTSSGGTNGQGVIFEWDPVDLIYTKKYDFDLATGINPDGTLVLNNGKLYGMTSGGGANNYGGIFEWDPVTNLYTAKSDFTGINGSNPDSKNRLTAVPAMAARGVPNTCVTYSPVIIDNSNTNNWVPLIDNNGFAIAEIKANGNNLGIVNASLFVNNNTIREDDARRLYLDRNITITPQFQPATPVDIRLYIRGTEFNTIKNATNSGGSPSGIATISDLGIFKNDDNCESSVIKKASSVSTTGATWETDYVLSASITKFSTFYFASKANAALPLTLLEFSGRLQNNNALLNWKTENELNTLEFIVERSLDGNQYKAIGAVAAANRPGIHPYTFSDPAINTLGVKIIYYRLKQYDIDRQFIYSKVVVLSLDNENTIVKLYPNPVNNELRLSISSPLRDDVKLQIIDASGRTINHQTRQVATGNNSFIIDVTKLSTGVYYLSIMGNAINKWMQFVKQ